MYIKDKIVDCCNLGKIKSLVPSIKSSALLFFSLVLTVLYGVLVWDKAKNLNDYLGMILLTLMCDIVLVVLYEKYKCRFSLITIVVFILHTGLLIRSICGFDSLWHEQGIMIAAIASLIIGTLSVKYLDMLKFDTKINIITLGTTLIVYLILAILAVAVRGTKAWLLGVQVTEIIKIIAILYFSYLLINKKLTEIKKMIYATIFVAINVLGSLLINELGSLLVMLIVYVVYLMLFIKSVKKLLLYFGVASLSSLLFAGVAFLGFKETIIEKLGGRITAWLHPEMDPTGLGFQALKAKEAIILGGLLGSRNKVVVPEVDSDYVFVGIAMKLGLILCIILLLAFVAFLVVAATEYINARTEFHSALIVGSAYYIFVQSIVMFGGSTGLIPMTGITVPLISSGGTSICIVMMMIGLIIGTHYTNYDLEIKDNSDEEIDNNKLKEKVYVLGKNLYSHTNVAYKTDIGNRKENQDDYFIDKETNVYAIFDGMGGGVKGGEASECLKQTIQEEIPKIVAQDLDVDDLIKEVNEVVAQISHDYYTEYNKNTFRYGTTIAMLIKYNGEFILFHAGDSRIYSIWNDSTIKLETEDHNIAWIARQDGMSEEEIISKRLSSRLLRYVGEKEVVLDVKRINVSNVKGLLLATDGLYSSLTDKEILDAFEKHSKADNVLDALMKKSLKRDGSDNTSGVCIVLDPNSE